MYALELLEERCELTLNQLLEKIQEKFPEIQSSKSALDQELKKMDITWKMVMSMLSSWNFEETLLVCQEYVSKIAFINCLLVFIDESGFNMQTKKVKADQ